ncbi:MAG TPA: c-type cytochrome [Paucimonas sp.]|nr:c-type cytochrome [Paucimonas sp.]
MRKLAWIAAAGLLAGQAFAAPPSSKQGKMIEKGRYLVSTSGCVDCHSPWKMGPNGPEPDTSRHLSGHPETLQMPPAPVLQDGQWLVTIGNTNTAFAGPWGVSFTANLTPDDETGLGKWTAEDFKATIRTGRHMGRGRPVLPPMPIMVYNNFTDQDLEAIFAYLRTIPAIKNRVPEPRPPMSKPEAAGK